MKAKDIIAENNIPEDECNVCKLHDEAQIKLNVVCPHCNEAIDIENRDYDIEVVGEGNFYDEEHVIEKMGVFQCEYCEGRIAMKLIPIKYNGNHDIYYTGGRNYVVDEKICLTPHMEWLIEDFTTRLKSGESLEAWNLKAWLTGEMEKEIARILYEKGLKF